MSVASGDVLGFCSPSFSGASDRHMGGCVRCASLVVVPRSFACGVVRVGGLVRVGGRLEVELASCIGSRVVVVDVVDDRVEVSRAPRAPARVVLCVWESVYRVAVVERVGGGTGELHR